MPPKFPIDFLLGGRRGTPLQVFKVFMLFVGAGLASARFLLSSFMRHGYGDMTLFVAFVNISMSLYDLFQRISSIDDRF